LSKPKKPRTADVARALAGPLLESLGLELWDLRFEKEGSGWYLRYFIDKPGGVTIADCETFSRAIEPLLDEAGPIDQSYILEVSAPGIERELKREEHFARYTGHRIRLRLIRPREGVKELFGELLGASGENIGLRADDGREYFIPKGEAAGVRLVK